MTVRIAPSLLSADFARLADEVARAEAGGADLLHVDVMDGRFVPPITIGPLVVAALKRVTRLPLDVHLMVVEPERHIEAFVDAGAAMVTVHAEVSPHLQRTLAEIRRLGARPGVAINPSTPVAAIREVLQDLDHVLVMSVNPGYGGQAFIPHCLGKVRQARELLAGAGSDAAIEVDGGVNPANARELVEAGTTILVAGASIFGTGDATAATRALRAAAGR